MSRLHIFGGSPSVPGYHVDPIDSWWGLTSSYLNLPVNNYAYAGCSIDSIVHIIISNPKFFSKDDIVFVVVPPIDRLPYFVGEEAKTRNFKIFTHKMIQTDDCTIPNYAGMNESGGHDTYGTEVVAKLSWSWREAQIIRDMLMLDSWFKKRIKQFYVLNCTVPFQPLTNWPTLRSLQQQMFATKRMLLTEDTMASVNENINKPVDFDTYGWLGHHGVAGNQLWFRTIKEKLKL